MGGTVEGEDKVLHWAYLAPRVLAVAVLLETGERRRPRPGSLSSRDARIPEWCGFVADAAADDGENEAHRVAEEGARLPKPVAEALWPDLHDQGLSYQERASGNPPDGPD